MKTGKESTNETPRTIQPPVIDAYLERLQAGVLLRRQGYYDLAGKVATDLIGSYPQESSVWHLRSQIWTDIGEFDSALRCAQRAIGMLKANSTGELADTPKFRHQIQTLSMSLGVALMRYARFEEGLPYFEAGRLGVSWSPWPGSEYLLNIPKEKRPVDSLLVQSEGGYGDTFMFMRWLPRLKAQGIARKVGLMVWKPLADFCDWKALGIDQVYIIDEDRSPFDWQASISIMSLPAVFGMKTCADIPRANSLTLQSSHPYRFDRYEPRSRGAKFALGFCWRAEENTSPTRTKSLPAEVAEQIISAFKTDIEVFSLSPQRADLYNPGLFHEPAGLIIEPDRMTSWRTTAEYICGMDFVLTVDTAVAHLAGLLGVPALVLLPRSNCWRWGYPPPRDYKPQVNSGWYGSTLTLYYQPVALEWNAEPIIEATLRRIGE
jgi:hypothetical protein